MLKKIFNFVMFVLGIALVCASMTGVSVKAFEQTQTMRDNKKEAGATWDDVLHDHEGSCYTTDWVDMRSTYNPVLNKREHIRYVLTNENEVLRFVYRDRTEVVSVSIPAFVPLALYLT